MAGMLAGRALPKEDLFFAIKRGPAELWRRVREYREYRDIYTRSGSSTHEPAIERNIERLGRRHVHRM